jgi:hypothetical protein
LWINKGVDGRPSPIMTALRGVDGSLSAMVGINRQAGKAGSVSSEGFYRGCQTMNAAHADDGDRIAAA